MNAYILTILAASLAAAIIELLSPKGEGGRIASHVRTVAGLFLLVALLGPLREGILFLRSAAEGNLTDRLASMTPDVSPEAYEEAFRDTLVGIGKEETEAWVLSALHTVFGIPSTGCIGAAVCETEGNTLDLREVRISLCGEYVLENPHPIETYIVSQLQCPCYVTVQP